MNELKQLIMQADKKAKSEKEFEQLIDAALASRPTCGVEQRKFLDEVEKLKSINDGAHFVDANGKVKLFGDSFIADLFKVIEGE